MKTQRIFKSILMISAIALFFAACDKKDDTTETPAATQVGWAADNAQAEWAYDDARDWSDLAMNSAEFKSSLTDTVYMGQCVLATLDTAQNPDKLTIDFGTSNCQCTDGHYRRGKIIVTFTGNYFFFGTVVTYTFEDYFIDDNQILGTKVVTNKGLNNAGHIWWTVDVTGQVIKANNGGTFTWNSSHEIEWSEGMETLMEWWDDVYLITGAASGVTVTGLTYTHTIITPLKKKLNCQWVVSGSIDLQVQNLPLITFDYGAGTCDNQATVTVAGGTYNITL